MWVLIFPMVAPLLVLHSRHSQQTALSDICDINRAATDHFQWLSVCTSTHCVVLWIWILNNPDLSSLDRFVKRFAYIEWQIPGSNLFFSRGRWKIERGQDVLVEGSFSPLHTQNHLKLRISFQKSSGRP